MFGKLPESRPGIRSPRRRQAGGKATARKPSAAATRGRAPKPPASKPAVPDRPAPPRAEHEEQAGVNGLEDLAWAGVAAAAEAATIGVRLASRAFEALRGPTERR